MNHTPRILVVDDEPDICTLVTFYLSRREYQVCTAADGIQALEAVDAEPPDLVVLDLMLPGMTGWEILRELRRRPRLAGLPVVMLTARREEEDRATAEALGAADFITKPFSPAELVRRIDAVLRTVFPAGPAFPARSGE